MPSFGAFPIVKRFSFSLQLLLGLVVGVALGFAARIQDLAWLATTLTEVGKIFVQLLKLAVPPLVFTAILVSVANLRNVNNAARLAAQDAVLVPDHLADRGRHRHRPSACSPTPARAST